MSFRQPVTTEALALLPPEKARQVQAWSANHAKIWTLRIHRPDSCPWLYSLDYAFQRHDTPWWADRVWRFYAAKHAEEGHCDCDVQLKGKDDAA